MTQLTPLARHLRAGATKEELLVWRELRAKRFANHKFKRQQPLGRFIVDFVSFDARLIIEIDGGQHNGSPEDAKRDRWLRDQGFKVLRFWNSDVHSNIDGVLTTILACLSPSPHPSPVKGEGASRRDNS